MYIVCFKYISVKNSIHKDVIKNAYMYTKIVNVKHPVEPIFIKKEQNRNVTNE